MANIVNGKEYKLYVNTTSEPADPDEITNYTLVGLSSNLNYSDTTEQLTSNNKDNGARVTTLPGNQSATLTGTVEWGHDSDAGQEIVWNAVDTTTVANKTVYFLVTSNTGTDIQFRGSGVATEWSLDLNNNEISSASFTIAVSGAITKEAVD